jgi:hypothetical protein
MAIAIDRLLDCPIKPCVPFLKRGQKRRHGLGVNRAHHVIRFRGQECEKLMLAGLAFPLASP